MNKKRFIVVPIIISLVIILNYLNTNPAKITFKESSFYPNQTQKLPDAIIIGVSKCGKNFFFCLMCILVRVIVLLLKVPSPFWSIWKYIQI